MNAMLATILVFTFTSSGQAQEDPLSPVEIQARIDRIRKTDAEVTVVDSRGRPIPGATVKVEQTRHRFLFGANAFPLLGDRDPKREALYEKRFTDLLNYATVPFYWGAYEPTPGKTREAAVRRQAEWLRDHGVSLKGHPLVWHEVYPGWAPKDPDETEARLHDRVTEIVSHFKGLIDRWDVVNEATVSARTDTGVGAWAKRDGAASMVATCLRWAHAANPKAVLLYNDYNISQDLEDLLGALLKAKAPISVIGLQSHMHGGETPLPDIWQRCEAYARFGLPIHFTELTVLSGEHGWNRALPWPTTAEGEERQADYVEKLYALLFSHPAVEAITWWDLMDGGWMGAPAGLIRADYSTKPAYDRLLKLIKGKWWTQLELRTDPKGKGRFRGFFGSYRIEVTSPNGTQTAKFELVPGKLNRIRIVVGAAAS